MEVARPAGPPPTMSTSNGSTSRAAEAEAKLRAATELVREEIGLIKKDAGGRRQAGVVAAAADGVAVERSFWFRRFILLPVRDDIPAGRNCRRRRLLMPRQQLPLLLRRRRAAAFIEGGRGREEGCIRRPDGVKGDDGVCQHGDWIFSRSPLSEGRNGSHSSHCSYYLVHRATDEWRTT
jgi:hypothetical protein